MRSVHESADHDREADRIKSERQGNLLFLLWFASIAGDAWTRSFVGAALYRIAHFFAKCVAKLS